MPTKRLPSRPNLDHLKHQAKDLLADFRARKLDAFQRIREFHPRFHAASDAEIGEAALTLSDAHLAIAREYGFNTWPRLKKHIESDERAKLDRPHVDRIEDAEFRSALILADDGDLDGLRAHLARHRTSCTNASCSRAAITSGSRRCSSSSPRTRSGTSRCRRTSSRSRARSWTPVRSRTHVLSARRWRSSARVACRASAGNRCRSSTCSATTARTRTLR